MTEREPNLAVSKQKLVSDRLGLNVGDFIRTAYEEEKKAYPKVAKDIAEATGIEVHWTTVRKWGIKSGVEPRSSTEYQTEEVRREISRKTRETWKDPQIRESRQEGIKRAWRDDVRRMEMMKKIQTPEANKKRSDAAKRRFQK